MKESMTLKLIMKDLGTQAFHIAENFDRKHASLSNVWMIENIDELENIHHIMAESRKTINNDFTHEKSTPATLDIRIESITTQRSIVESDGDRDMTDIRSVNVYASRENNVKNEESGVYEQDGYEDYSEEEGGLLRSNVSGSQNGSQPKFLASVSQRDKQPINNKSSSMQSSNSRYQPISGTQQPSDNQRNSKTSNLLKNQKDPLQNKLSVSGSKSKYSPGQNNMLRKKTKLSTSKASNKKTELPQIRDKSASRESVKSRHEVIASRDDKDRLEKIVQQQKAKQAEIDQMFQLKYIPGKTKLPFVVTGRPKLPEYTMPNKKLEAQKKQVFKCLGYETGEELMKGSYQWDKDGNMDTEIHF